MITGLGKISLILELCKYAVITAWCVLRRWTRDMESILNKQSWTPNKGLSSSFGIDQGLTNPHRKEK
jgi:hypothetical protein